MSEKKQLPASNNLNQQVKRTPNLPVSYLNLAATSNQVSQNWAIKFPNYRLQYFSLSDLQTEAQQFGQAVNANNQNKADKKQNTANLAQASQRLNTAARALRNYLKAEFVALKDLSAVYVDYGFVKAPASKIYSVPTDNDGKVAFIQSVLRKLNQAQNPIANLAYGLGEWQQIQQQFETAWNESRVQKSAITDSSSTARRLYSQLRQKLTTLQTCIGLDFPNDKAATLRSFGFLKETF